MSADSCSFVPLAILVERTTGGGTPPRGVPSFWGGDIPWASVKDFSDNEIDLHSTEESITLAGLAASAARLIAAGTPLVCTRMAVGRCAAAAKPVAINQDLKALEPSQGVDNRFLLHALKRLQPALQARAVGSTVKGIALRDLLSAQVIRLPLPEQRRVAEILDTLDEAIRKTEQVIAKLQQMKQGLLHDLLTRGIDENGKLRDPERHPEQFKDSPLGWIPREWNVEQLQRVTSLIIDGTHYTPTYTTVGIPFLRVTDVHNDSIDPATTKYISESEHRALIKRCHPTEGDVLLSKNGTVGIPRVVDWSWSFSIFVSLALIRPRAEELNSEYLATVLSSFLVAQQIKRRSKQATVTNLHLEEIRQFLIPLPEVEEQNRIVTILQRLVARESSGVAELDKLRTLKRGLMDDLLTGRVRVSVPEEAATWTATLATNPRP